MPKVPVPRLACLALTAALLSGCSVLAQRTGLSADEALAIARTSVEQPPLADGAATPMADAQDDGATTP